MAELGFTLFPARGFLEHLVKEFVDNETSTGVIGVAACLWLINHNDGLFNHSVARYVPELPNVQADWNSFTPR